MSAKKKINHKNYVEAMIKIVNPPANFKPMEVKIRKKRAVETKPRDMAEKMLERRIIHYLKTHGCIIGKCGEQATYNSHYIIKGMSDLICISPNIKMIYFIECKIMGNPLRPSQWVFKDLIDSIRGNIKHIIAYSINDVTECF